MLQFFKRCSQGRLAWLLMATTALLLELAALYFQHVMLLQPCVMCIYERCALFGVLGAALAGAFAPKSPLRYAAILLWIYSAWQGAQMALKHTMIQLHPSPFSTCDFFVTFPSWLTLDKWLTAVFYASGDCAAHQWSFLTLTMPQWLVGIFAVYLVAAVMMLIAQFVRTRRRNLFGR
ncbi:disulfide bond formation protein DsbB [Serratia symbiotica]|uniref:disulfide bond formation protein DsbB n=1 Tax=Serratia symbiotica TaxID=138074 RepID=UPI001DE201E2|nr:disulfide bond formation protein DsbB [Serratia symbiotica]NIG87623.1 disulfide bond formation protein DsbB [Serratia symbiotica]USS96369.1 disulfide bond formation protein DsbB [Serratia symbiotica]